MANNDLVGSLTKGMDILKLVGNSEHGLKAGEIAAALNLKTSTCYNLVRTLCAGDFLERRGRYGNRFRHYGDFASLRLYVRPRGRQ